MSLPPRPTGQSTRRFSVPGAGTQASVSRPVPPGRGTTGSSPLPSQPQLRQGGSWARAGPQGAVGINRCTCLGKEGQLTATLFLRVPCTPGRKSSGGSRQAAGGVTWRPPEPDATGTPPGAPWAGWTHGDPNSTTRDQAHPVAPWVGRGRNDCFPQTGPNPSLGRSSARERARALSPHCAGQEALPSQAALWGLPLLPDVPTQPQPQIPPGGLFSRGRQ